MSHRVRLILCGSCIAVLIGGIAVVQNRAADADSRQPEANAETEKSDVVAKDDQPVAKSASADNVYFDLTAPLKAAREAEDAIRKALKKPITVNFKDTSLEKAVAHIGTLCGVQTDFDVTALHEEGIALDEAITFSRQQPLPAETILAAMLEPLGLGTTIEDEMLVISTEFGSEERLSNRLYNTNELARAGFKTDAIAKVIEYATSGPWMEIDGTGGSIDIFESLLNVRTTDKVHGEIGMILGALQRIASSPAKRSAISLDLTVHDQKAYTSLSRKVSGDFRDTPLKEVAAYLAKLANVNIALNETALEEEGIADDEPITFKFNNITLKSVLRRVLEPLGLTHVIHRGALMITTEIEAEEMLTMFVFNIRDFTESGYDVDFLIDSIQSSTSGPWFEIDGTCGTIIDILPGLLLISQTWRVNEETAFHLDELRAALKKGSPDGQLPKIVRDPNKLTLKHYSITSLSIEDVRDAIPQFVAPKSWISSEGKGVIAILESNLIIRQTRDVHKEIKKFLEEIGAIPAAGDFGFGIGSGSGFFSIED